MRTVLVSALSLLLSGCLTGKLDYSAPSTRMQENSKIVSRSREAVWTSAVPALGKQFYVINNLDKASGLINISYAGDPERYVDCGMIESVVSNARGERRYYFPAAQANQSYEGVLNNSLFALNRQMKLEGRMNLVFEELSPNQTRVTANTRYVMNRTVQARMVGGTQFPATRNDSASFNSNQSGNFPPANDGRSTLCVPTGRFEAEVLNLIE